MRYAVLCFRDNEVERIALWPEKELAEAACDGIDMCNDDVHFGVIWDIAAKTVVSPTADEMDDDDALADIVSMSTAAMADYYAGLRASEEVAP